MFLKIAALTIVSLIVVAALYKPVRRASLKMRRFMLAVLGHASEDLTEAADSLAEHSRSALAALANATDVWPWERVIGAFVYVALFLLALSTEVAILALVLEAWGFGTSPSLLRDHTLPVVSVGLLVSFTLWGTVLLDLAELTDLAPWNRLREDWLARLRMTCYLCISGAIASFFLIGLWKGVQTTESFAFLRGEIEATAPVLSQAILAAIAGLGAVVAGWSLRAVPNALFAIGVKFIEWPLRLVAMLMDWTATAVRHGIPMLLAVLRVPAHLGAVLWNWVARRIRFLGFGEIDLGDQDEEDREDEETHSAPKVTSAKQVSSRRNGRQRAGAEGRAGRQRPRKRTPTGRNKRNGKTEAVDPRPASDGKVGATSNVGSNAKAESRILKAENRDAQ
ncbi:MAG: hypothetical protein WBD55_13525 [Dehalococcoidia bacterium]